MGGNGASSVRRLPELTHQQQQQQEGEEESKSHVESSHDVSLINVGLANLHLDPSNDMDPFPTSADTLPESIEQPSTQTPLLSPIQDGSIRFYASLSRGESGASGHGTLETATILSNIAGDEYNRGSWLRALSTFMHCLYVQIEVLGPASLDAAVTICKIGQVYHQIGAYDLALKQYQLFLKLTVDKLGPNHHDIATVLRCIAEVTCAKGDLMAAVETYERALKNTREAHGEVHFEVALILNKLGDLNCAMMNFDAAFSYYSDGLLVESKIYGFASPSVMLTWMNLAQIQRFRRRYADAFFIYIRLKDLQVEAFGIECKAVARTWAYMGLMQLELHNLPAALVCYEHALAIQIDVTEDIEEAASTLNSIGVVYFAQGQYDPATASFANSLRIRLRLFGDDHHEVAVLWYNMARVYRHKGDEATAIMLYMESLRIARAARPQESNFVIQVLQHVGIIYQARGELNDALDFFIQALEVEKNKQHNCDILTAARMLNVIGNLHLQRADVANMMQCYVEASRLLQSIGANEGLIISGYSFYSQNRLHRACAPVA